MIFFPNCKINLGLHVLRRREDGFHDIETVMYPVRGLYDILEIVATDNNDIEFNTTGIDVDCKPEYNLCIKAYKLLASRYDLSGVKIRLHKIVPFGAGLGGGSSDAAFVIKGLNNLFRIGLNDSEMEKLAAELGSDTSFFIRNVPQIASGRGEILSEIRIPQILGKRLIIVKPDIHISTAEAYSGVKPVVPVAPLSTRITEDISLWKETIINDFEKHIFENYPALARIKQALYDSGALYASMSGSGSALFGIFELPPGQKDAIQNDSTDSYDGLLDNLNREFSNLFVYQEIIS